MVKTLNKRGRSEELQTSATPEVIRCNVSEIINNSFAEKQFQTKEEYIHHLADMKRVRMDSDVYKDGGIHILGNLPIDNNVISNLDWSDVVCDSATVMDGKISQYKYLPLARSGIKTNLMTEDAKDFVLHNAYGADFTNGKITINGIFRIPNLEILPDFSKVEADKVFCYAKKIRLSSLPFANKGIFGVGVHNLEIDCVRPASIAKVKGISKNICRELEPKQGLLQRLIGSLGNRNKKANSN